MLCRNIQAEELMEAAMAPRVYFRSCRDELEWYDDDDAQLCESVDRQMVSTRQTFELGRKLGQQLEAGDVVSVNGTLGAGKTWLIKGIVTGAIPYDTDDVTSPAFNLVYEYTPAGEFDKRVFHMDFYRLDTLTAEDYQMFDEYFAYEDGIILAEWGDKFMEQFTQDFLKVEIRLVDDEPESRIVKFSSSTTNARYADLLLRLDAVC
jgi:tRNA threonylcarbamoyladenosine biosynthesis protein TsaE